MVMVVVVVVVVVVVAPSHLFPSSSSPPTQLVLTQMRAKAEEDRKYMKNVLEHLFGVARETVSSLTERPLTLLVLVVGVMLVVAGVIASRDMVAVGRKVLERRWARPALVREYWRGGSSSRGSKRSWWKGGGSSCSSGGGGGGDGFEGIYLPVVLEERLVQLVAEVHGAKDKGLPLRNLLIYGPSGEEW